jgi:predicted methyltransferase
MAKLPRNPTEAVAELGIEQGQRIVAVGPASGYAEALGEAVGEKGSVVVVDPAPEYEAAAPVSVADAVPEDAAANVLVVWSPPHAAHTARDLRHRVEDGGSVWVVLRKASRDAPATVNEADLKRTMLAAGWRGDRMIGLSPDAYALRFRRRK